MKTIVIEIYGGPSIGKSTCAAELYSAFKHKQVRVEIAHEYVKRWAWEGRPVGAFDAYYILGKQIKEESSLFGKVDVVVSECPVALSATYAELYAPEYVRRGIAAAVRSYYDAVAQVGHRRIAVMLPRRHRYEAEGRFEDEGQAMIVDAIIATQLGNFKLETDALREMGAKKPADFEAFYQLRGAPDYCGVDDIVVDVARLLTSRGE
jgi:RecA/RadA recombinase